MAWQDREKEWENLQAVQHKLGEVSMIWSAIDRQIDVVLTDMLDIGPAQTAAIVTGILPTKKCSIISRLLLLGTPSIEWRSQMDKLLKIIIKWGVDRNRLVHDAWRFEVSDIHRVDARAQTKATQSRKEKQLVFDQVHPVTLEDLDQLCKTGHDILKQLDELCPALVPWLLKRREELFHPQD